MKYLVALAALLTAAPSVPQEVAEYPHDEAAIVLVYCQRTAGAVTGTAFKVSETAYITAHHVVVGGACFVAGQRVTVTSLDDKRDYATFTGPASPAVIRPSCAGFNAGQTYAARGYPGGGTYNIFAPWQATRATMGGFRVFMASDSIPGMSGGPVLDAQGRAVGIVSMRWPARSMPLQLTGYCKA
jgi:S1-C subfamily serine protease